MASPSQRKGDGWERDVKQFLEGYGIVVHRLRMGGIHDEGDFAIGPFAAQAKNYPNDLVRAINEAMAAASEAGGRTRRLPMAIVKRRGRATEHGLAIMDLRTFAKVLVTLTGREVLLFGEDA